MDTQTPTYSNDELTAALAEHLASLDLSRLEAVGFHMPDWEEELRGYLCQW